MEAPSGKKLELGAYGRVLVLAIPDLPDADEVNEREFEEEDRDWRRALRGYRLGA